MQRCEPSPVLKKIIYLIAGSAGNRSIIRKLKPLFATRVYTYTCICVSRIDQRDKLAVKQFSLSTGNHIKPYSLTAVIFDQNKLSHLPFLLD